MYLVTDDETKENTKWALVCYFEILGKTYSHYSSYLNHSFSPMIMNRFLADADWSDVPKMFDTKREVLQWMENIRNDLLKIESIHDEDITSDKDEVSARKIMAEYLSTYSVRSVMFIIALYDGKLNIEYNEDALEIFSKNRKIYVKFQPRLIHKYKRREN